MIELESLDDAAVTGFYMVQVCEYPAANPKSRAYQVYRFDAELSAQFADSLGWWERMHGARAHALVYGWHGPLDVQDMEALDDPTEMGYYVVWLQPWPNQTPKYKEFAVCVWRRGAWYDRYGYAKQYGNVLGWAGPFQELPVTYWMKQHEKEEAEDIGL